MIAKLAMGAAAAAAMVLLFSHYSTALAQYPAPVGSAALTASKTSAVLGERVSVTLTVRDTAGKAVANKPCTMAVSKQPGADASVQQDRPTTDPAGAISGTLYVGTTPGTIEVTATCDGVSARVSVVAGVSVQPVPSAVTLPPTGVGRTGGGVPAVTWAMGLGLLGALSLVGAGCLSLRRRPRE